MFGIKKQLFTPSIRSLIASPKEAMHAFEKDEELCFRFLDYFLDRPDELGKNIPMILLFLKHFPEKLLAFQNGVAFFDLLKENELLQLQFPAISSLVNAAIITQNKKEKSDLALSYLPEEMQNKQNPLSQALLSWIDLEKKDPMQRTPLHLAAISGHIALLKYLLSLDPKKAKSLLKAVDIEKKTALHHAAAAKDLSMIEYLIEQGSQVNALDHEQKSPLHYAAGIGQIKIVELLLEKGANPKQKDLKGKVPLIFAIEHSSETVAKHLCQLTNIQQRDDLGKLPLHYACQYENLALIRFLLPKTEKKNLLDKSGKAPIHHLALLGFTKALALFEKQDLHLPDAEKKTPLHIACKHKQVEFCEALLRKKVPMEAKDQKKKTPIFYAVEFHLAELTELLIKKKARVNVFDHLGNTPLHIAVKSGNLNQVQLLVEKGAKLDAQDLHGHAPLHFAAAMKEEKITKFLIEQKADLRIRDKEGKTPAHLAAAINEPEMLELLLTPEMIHEVDHAKNNCLHVLLMNKHPSMKGIEILMKHTIDMNGVNHSQQTPLHKAMKTQNLELISLLVKHSSNINTQDKLGKTPLYLACQYADADDTKILHLLLKNHADPNIPDKEGMLPLDKVDEAFVNMRTLLKEALKKPISTNLVLDAVKLKDESKLRAVLQTKVDANVLDAEKKSPLFWAVEYENVQMVDSLVAHGGNPLIGNPSAFLLALEKENPEMLKSLSKAKISWDPLMKIPNNFLAKLIQEKKTHVLKNILPLIHKKQPDLLEKKYRQTTLLHLAIQNKLPKELLKPLNRPPIHAFQDQKGRTPLELAKEMNYKTAINLLGK